jgi:hypothetical protein
MKKIFSKNSCGIPQGKKFENFFIDERVSICIPIDAVFHWDYESGIILVGKTENVTDLCKFMAYSYPNGSVSRRFFPPLSYFGTEQYQIRDLDDKLRRLV